MANGKDDIRVALGWPRHFKRRALQRELGPAGPLALVDLWCFAGEHRPDGVFKSQEEVEVAVEWPKAKRGKLVAALIATGWLESDGVTIHDWAIEQPWIANRSARVAAARANGSAGGRAKAERTRQSATDSPTDSPTGSPSGIVADGYRNAGEVLPPSPSPSPTPSPTPRQPRARPPDAAAAESLGAEPPGPEPGQAPSGLADRLAARIRWPSPATVASMLDELRAEGFPEADLEARVAATPDGRVQPWDWARAARKARGTTAATTSETERVAARRSAHSWADRARAAAVSGDAQGARRAWGQALVFAAQAGMDDLELGAPP